jgi:Rod binding domain-containing protein
MDGIEGLAAPLVPLDPESLSPAATYFAPSGSPGARYGAAGPDAQGAALEKTARDFESVLLHRVFEEMRRSVPESGLLDSGTSDQVQGMFWMYLAQDVAAKGGIGLAKELSRQFSRMQHDVHLAPGESPGANDAAEAKP